jgi:hypothetical protein
VSSPSAGGSGCIELACLRIAAPRSIGSGIAPTAALVSLEEGVLTLLRKMREGMKSIPNKKFAKGPAMTLVETCCGAAVHKGSYREN